LILWVLAGVTHSALLTALLAFSNLLLQSFPIPPTSQLQMVLDHMVRNSHNSDPLLGGSLHRSEINVREKRVIGSRPQRLQSTAPRSVWVPGEAEHRGGGDRGGCLPHGSWEAERGEGTAPVTTSSNQTPPQALSHELTNGVTLMIQSLLNCVTSWRPSLPYVSLWGTFHVQTITGNLLSSLSFFFKFHLDVLS
jgi:hypothetical protein